MKKFLSTFVMITIGIILISGLYVWLSQKDKVLTLSYVPDPGWSEQHIISPYIKSHKYDCAVDEAGNLHILWIEHERLTGVANIKYSSFNSSGKIITEPKTIAQNEQILAVAIIIRNKMLHTFWVGQGNSKKLDLFYTNLDLAGKVVNEQIVLEDEYDGIEDLIVVSSLQGDFMLVWTNKLYNYQQVKTLLVNSLDMSKRSMQNITSSSHNSDKPNLIADENSGFHLTWREKDTKDFYYQRLNDEGQIDSEPLLIDKVHLDTVSMVVKKDKLYLVWNKIMSNVSKVNIDSVLERSFPNYELFGTVINLNRLSDHQIQIQRLTKKNGPSFDHSLVVDSLGQVHLAYLETYHNSLALTHEIFEDNFTNIKKSRRIYPDQVSGSQIRLLKDQDKGVHMVWLEAGLYGGNFNYANTVIPKKTSLLQILGFNATHYDASITMSIFYLCAMPIFNILFFLHPISIICVSVIVIRIGRFLQNTKVSSLFSKLYVNNFLLTSLVCILHSSLYIALGKKGWLLWPTIAAPNQMCFIIGLAFLGTLILKAVNKYNKASFIQVGAVVVAWVYWLNMINLFFNLPYINF